jgi:endonuclease-3 related protein
MVFELDAIPYIINDIYQRLWETYGPQAWWPADTTLEVMVGAVLTQNTNWRGVEKSIANLRHGGLLSIDHLHDVETNKLAGLIRPSGYFNLKAGRLKNLIYMVVNDYGGDLEAMGREETEKLRRELLAVKGVGPETADSILLYGFNRPMFVIDTYTRRVLSRHGFAEPTSPYEELQELFTQHLPLDASIFNEYHALLVKVGKLHCQKKSRCRGCPLEPLLPAVNHLAQGK